jgi:hypothetical protein
MSMEQQGGTWGPHGDGRPPQPGTALPSHLPSASALPGYPPPGSAVSGHPPPGHTFAAPPRPRYSLHGLGRWTAGLFWAATAFFGALAIARLADADAATGPLSALAILVTVALIPLFIVWLYQARHNVTHLSPPHGPGGQGLGPGWAIGSWFIPLANLVLPLLVTLRVWHGSRPDLPRAFPTLVAGWWTCWVLTWITGAGYTERTVTHANGGTRTDYTVTFLLGATPLSAACAAVCAALAALLVQRIRAAQEARPTP